MQKKNWVKINWMLPLLLMLVSQVIYAGNIKQAIETQIDTDIAAQKSQQQIDNLADETTQMLEEYREVLRQTDSLHAYNDQLDRLVSSQKKELDSIDIQLRNIESTQRDIVPLMLKMIDAMAQFVELDIPFLPDERQDRVVQLKTLMERSDVTIAEKYRRILEAYQVETEYGRTIEAYQGDLTMADATRTVEFLRIGRVSLYYLTLDGQEVGMWDQQWKQLDDDYREPVAKAIKVARKQLPPDLLVLPIKTVEVTE
ncbi:MAG: DUF3450 domain-containing protein [Gammaproteobacteria bacterium]|nr:DUF3450 domain-containing protein [Gammaproteobacteria bacterium]